jgi:SHS2 domain-containing protein
LANNYKESLIKFFFKKFGGNISMEKSFYEPIYDITADAGIKVFGSSLQELICNAVKGLINEMVDLSKVDHKEEITVEVESIGFPYSLADVLNKILYLFDVKKFVPAECKVLEISPTGEKVKLVLKGERYNPEKHGRKLLVKAATYHRIKMEKKDGKYIGEVIFDI